MGQEQEQRVASVNARRCPRLDAQEATVAFKIRQVVEGGLPEVLRKIPIEKRFNKGYVREVRGRRQGRVGMRSHPSPHPLSEGDGRTPLVVAGSGALQTRRRTHDVHSPPPPAQICREADGYQPHLVSPERGIKRLVQEAMLLTNQHVHRCARAAALCSAARERWESRRGSGAERACGRATRALTPALPRPPHPLTAPPPLSFVDEIHMVLSETVRESARRSVLSEAGVADPATAKGLDFLRLRGFENAVVTAANQALEEWRTEAHHGGRARGWRSGGSVGGASGERGAAADAAGRTTAASLWYITTGGACGRSVWPLTLPAAHTPRPPRPAPHPPHAAVAETMVQMECSYVTPSYFREMEREYRSGLAAEPADPLDMLAAGRVSQQSGGADDSGARDRGGGGRAMGARARALAGGLWRGRRGCDVGGRGARATTSCTGERGADACPRPRPAHRR